MQYSAYPLGKPRDPRKAAGTHPPTSSTACALSLSRMYIPYASDGTSSTPSLDSSARSRTRRLTIQLQEGRQVQGHVMVFHGITHPVTLRRC
jgi:hypothetical protein